MTGISLAAKSPQLRLATLLTDYIGNSGIETFSMLEIRDEEGNPAEELRRGENESDQDWIKRARVWIPLAGQLNLPIEQVSGLWQGLGKEKQQELWLQAINLRIDTAQSHRTLQAVKANRIQAKALDRLETMIDAGMIRSTGELLAIARLTGNPGQPIIPAGQGNPGQPTQGGVNLSISFGAGGAQDMKLGNGATLPGGEEVMHIDLSPRVVQSIQRRSELDHEGNPTARVIDASMMQVEDLRRLRKTSTGEITTAPLESENDNG